MADWPREKANETCTRLCCGTACNKRNRADKHDAAARYARSEHDTSVDHYAWDKHGYTNQPFDDIARHVDDTEHEHYRHAVHDRAAGYFNVHHGHGEQPSDIRTFKIEGRRNE